MRVQRFSRVLGAAGMGRWVKGIRVHGCKGLRVRGVGDLWIFGVLETLQ